MPILQFQIPEKVVMEKDNTNFGKFLLKPLEPGYGITIGNAFRRILLSSLEGYAITAIKIPSILHEFSTIPGVMEDLVDVILNLKQVRLRCTEFVESKIFVSIKGKTTFTAEDIVKHTSVFSVANPELVIAHLNPDTQFDIELTIGKGRGYVPAEENKTHDMNIGDIAVDAIFTPIKNVRYYVENTRVEQRTDYEQLIIEIVTDGTIDPENALKEAADILIRHFGVFTDSTFQLKREELPSRKNEMDENWINTRKLLKTPLSELDLSVRAFNCLKAAEIRTLADLVSYNIADMLKFRNFGKKSLTELEELVATKNLTFGMDVEKYRIDEDI